MPALSVDGNVLTENVAIMTYLTKRFSDAQLLPQGLSAILACAIESPRFHSGRAEMLLAGYGRAQCGHQTAPKFEFCLLHQVGEFEPSVAARRSSQLRVSSIATSDTMLVDDGQWALTLSVPYNRATQMSSEFSGYIAVRHDDRCHKSWQCRLRCGDTYEDTSCFGLIWRPNDYL